MYQKITWKSENVSAILNFKVFHWYKTFMLYLIGVDVHTTSGKKDIEANVPTISITRGKDISNCRNKTEGLDF